MLIDPTFMYSILAFVSFMFIINGIKIVPQQNAWIVEKLGRFDRKLEPGLNFLIPGIERVSYKHSLKEQAVDVMQQTAITNDNVTLSIDGVLYVRIIDPIAASYGVTDPYYAIIQLAQTTMRSEIGKIQMDKTFEEREMLNANIVEVINEAAANWGIQCMRYEIKDINPPTNVLKAMEMQVEAERRKRAEILESEGKKQAAINIAEGQKRQVVLESEAAMTDQINRATGEADAIELVATATASAIQKVAESIQQQGGEEAVSLRVAEQYIDAFGNLARTNNTLILPGNSDNLGNLIAQSMAIFKHVQDAQPMAANAKPKQPLDKEDSW